MTQQLPPVLDDATRQRNLTRMKRWAAALLVVAGVVFLVATYFEMTYPWVGYIRATAEAAVIGGLADWFAVTALFRHPLGIPIPHTAIIPTRKDRLGRTLGTFVQNHFLSREVLSTRLRAMRIAERLARWISEPENGRVIARQVASGLARTARALPPEPMRDLVRDGIVGRLQAMPVAPLLRNALSLVRAGNKHQDLLSEAVRLAARAVDENRDRIRDKVKHESPWWVPGIVDDKIYHRILLTVETLLDDVGGNPEHPLRAKFDIAIEQYIDKLQHSPDTIARAEALKQQLLADPVMDEFADWLWDYLRDAAVSRAEAPDDGTTPGPIERGLASFGQSLATDPDMLAKLDDAIVERTTAIVEQYRTEVSDLIAHTVAGWDPMVTSRRIELAIGRDLQFIRINGTLVGGLLGLILHTVLELIRLRG
ncbi:MAG: DUF445 domain-containing protein [Gemmatimonadetes bacterium]|nr:DUF445 domain-containing protein [Gemmatimonadota bacterium]MCC7133832.1 DUF445 domain-containing protein [Gemmatimonadales bacterium]